MSENLDLVRSIYADWERGDFSSAGWADSEIEYVLADGPEPGTWTGLAAMAEGHREFLQPFQDLRMVVDEYRELDGERVLVLVHVVGRGKISGVDLDQVAPSGWGADLFHVRDGRVTRLVVYYDGERALADLGLEEQAVSRENVEIVRCGFLALERGGVDAAAKFWHPAISWRAMEGAPDDVGEMHGIEAARRYVEDWFDTFDNFRSEPEELIAVGDDQVVAVVHISGRAKASGIETELRYASVSAVRDGKIVRVREYATKDDALEAMRLAE